MMLAVAGLNDEAVKNQTKKLALGDWSDFAPAERQAFAFAAKLAKTPWAISPADMNALRKTFGDHRAIDILWYSSWVNYMTRVADAFQLPLEKTNVFAEPPTPPMPSKNPKPDTPPKK